MSKKINIALFGFGRIGRNLFRLGYNNPNYNIVAVSDFGSAEALHYLLVRDSIHGSMDDDVVLDGRTFTPGQGNNAYIFPGVGLGIVLTRSKFIPNDLFLVAAKTLAGLVTNEELSRGQLYPSLSGIRNVSKTIAINIAKKAISSGLTNIKNSDNFEKHLETLIYNPEYQDYI